MVVPRFRDDPVVDALRWLMAAVMLIGGVLTLAGQPAAYWHHPDLAIRHDGLGLHDPINHPFEFFLSNGPWAFSLCVGGYIVSAFVLTVILPRNWALLLIFTAVLSHNYTGMNWLATRWHLGMQAHVVYGLAVGLPLAMLISEPSVGTGVQRRMALIAAAALLADMAFTLLGQSHSYWSHPEMVLEGNPLSRYFLVHGWKSFVVYDLIYAYVLFRAVVLLPRLAGLTVACCFILASFDGASNWLFYVWRQGMPAVAAYALVVSVALVILVFRRHHKDGAPRRSGVPPFLSPAEAP